MRLATLFALTLSLSALACQSGPRVVEADGAQREQLMTVLQGLEGRWETPGPEGEMLVTEFKVTSGGTALRELMYAGAPHEMTNMYTLDGNSVLMTHYCAGGNQPHMRAAGVEGGKLVFRSDGVSDLKAPDEIYMGEMTLVLVDDDHIEQHWTAFNSADEDHAMVMAMSRLE